MNITAVIIAQNEQDRIADAVASALAVCDEVLVVDGGSVDATIERAIGAGAQVVTHAFDDFAAQKNFGNQQATHPWILSLDSDERISQALAVELNALKQSEPSPDVAAFAFPRHTHYLGRVIRHNWYPDVRPRLFRKDRAQWVGDWVHESLRIDGRSARLRGPLLHYSYRDISDHFRKIDVYTSRAAQKIFQEGGRASMRHYALLPHWQFFVYYVVRRGFLDGWPGFVVAALSSYSVALKYLKVRELWRNASRGIKKS
jgi:glycosyltransferase involved in cell wall biosynthesis